MDGWDLVGGVIRKWLAELVLFVLLAAIAHLACFFCAGPA